MIVQYLTHCLPLLYPSSSTPNVTVMWLADSSTSTLAALDKVAKEYIIIDKYQTKVNMDELIDYDVSKTEPSGPLSAAIVSASDVLMGFKYLTMQVNFTPVTSNLACIRRVSIKNNKYETWIL